MAPDIRRKNYMYNQAPGSDLRICVYCGKPFTPLSGETSFCCFGHKYMHNRGVVPDETVPFTQQAIFPKPPSPKCTGIL